MENSLRPTCSGFTLIELLVVLGLIAIISVMVLPSISSYFQVSLDSATRDMASTVKEAYNTTLITGTVHRMVYDIKNGQYWVERGTNDVLIDTKESREYEKKKSQLVVGKKEEVKSPFSMDTTVTRKKLSLPRGVKFDDVYTEQSKDPMIDGLAFSHIFPSGMTEQTLIHLSDDSAHHTSLSLTPIMGKTDVYDREIKPEDVFGK